MATDYQRIADENVRKYGTDIGRYGPTLLAHLYAERTHFLYELLQNAEDALARRVKAEGRHNYPKRVSFHLHPDRLEFRHFGQPFDGADVRGICGLVEGTAADDPMRIGKFGIGFKSVYAYTSSPEIHSGDEHFQILDYVRPRSVSETSVADGETLFILRFDNPDVVPAVAHKEIAECLRGIGARTLLFLRFMEEVDWLVEGGARGSYRRETAGDIKLPTLRLTALRNGDAIHEEFCLFETEVHGDSAKVAVAFRLERDSENGTPQVLGLGKSPLVVFFPTKIETDLQFMVQGPYRTTPTRETIHEDDVQNRKLIAQTASLLADCLPRIRDMGLLTPSFLESLPLNATKFPVDSLFRPIFEGTRHALRNLPLLPANDGGFVPAIHAKLASSAALRELLSDQQLTALLGSSESIKWLSAQLTERRTPDLYAYLIRELGIEEITPEKCAQRFTLGFIEQQTDKWVANLYGFLADQPYIWREGDRWRQSGPLRNKPFIRLTDAHHVPPFGADDVPNAFLPPDGDTEFPIVKREICADERAYEFLANKLRLTKPDVVAEVLKNILPRYQRMDVISCEQHSKDLCKILDALRAVAGQNRATLVGKLRQTPFLRAVGVGTSEPRYLRATDVYLRSPELESYFSGCQEAVWFLDETLEADARSLLENLGVANSPRRQAFRPQFDWQKLSDLRRSGGCTNELELTSYELHGLTDCLKRVSTLPFLEASSLACLVWKFLFDEAPPSAHVYHSTPDFFQGTYRWFRRNEHEEHFLARFVERLQESAWLPGKDGQLHKTSELSLDDLPGQFLKNETLERVLQMRPRTIDALAKETGLDPQVLDYLRKNPTELSRLQRLMATERARGEVLEQQTETATAPSNAADSGKWQEPGKPASQTTRTEARQARLETRVYVESLAESGNSQEAKRQNEKRNATGNTGIQKVLEYERKQNRNPQDKSDEKLGYDIESADVDGAKRFIEVKSVSGNWDALGVGMTAPEFQKAQELSEQYWLYVVERTEQDDAEIHRIQNPAHLVNQFFYDKGWKGLSEIQQKTS
jgi:hypothetical protein